MHDLFPGIRYRLLGPVELCHDGTKVDLPSTKVRLMLTALALAPNTVVSFETLGDVLWEGGAPVSARSNVRTYATALRRVLDHDCRLVSRDGGYLLATAPEQLDVQVFARLTGIGRRELAGGEPASASIHLRQALALWRGHPGEGLPPRRVLTGSLDALAEQRLLAQEDLLEAELALGRHAEQVGVARRLVAAHPLRERGWAALMLALYRSGDIATALEAFAAARKRLVDGLGLEPGARLRQLHAAMLNQDSTLLVPPGVSTASPRRQLPHQAPLVERDDEVRTVVSQVCDLSTDGPQVVVVYGPPGAGKSAIALLAAHRAVLGFPDGQLYLDLAAGGPDPATSVEVGWGGGWGRERLTGARMLVVVDHCTSATQLRQLLVPEPGCAYVITSDSPLAAVDATARIPVGRLSTSAAVTMLASLTGRSRLTPERLAEALVARCDHLPLAIRAAAAVLIQCPELRLQDLLPRLHDGELLNELAVDDLDLRARLLGRYRRLSAIDPGTAAWFRRLGRGHAVTDLPPPVARKLMAHGLLESGRLSHFVRLVATELAVDAYPGRHARDDRGSRPAGQGEQDDRVASA